jgi:RimJ/RimL family protein N-acetyltransferase
MKISVSNSLENTDFELFVKWFESNISHIYPYSTSLTAESIVKKHIKGFDEDGYFTKRKTIWKGVDEASEPMAFTVVSEKRGGSIKFGPTIVSKNERGKGVGSIFRKNVEEYYSSVGYRKAYSTTNLDNLPAIRYILKIGYKIELHLRNHYTFGKDELVLSKSIGSGSIPLIPNIAAYDGVPPFLMNYLNAYYTEIDATFFDNLNRAVTNNKIKDEEFFIQKKKYLHQSVVDGQYAIVTPKRGGCAKVFPLILGKKTEKAKKFIFELLDKFDSFEIHKFYTFVPLNELENISSLQSIGFEIEGIISSPYKVGINLLVLSLFKKNIK